MSADIIDLDAYRSARKVNATQETSTIALVLVLLWGVFPVWTFVRVNL